MKKTCPVRLTPYRALPIIPPYPLQIVLNMIYFDVVTYNKSGKRADCVTYSTHKLNELGGHWMVVRRMVETVEKRKKKGSIVKVFMNGEEYAPTPTYTPTGKTLKDY